MTLTVETLAALLRECFREPLNVYRVNCRGASKGMTVGPMSYHPDEFAGRLAALLAPKLLPQLGAGSGEAERGLSASQRPESADAAGRAAAGDASPPALLVPQLGAGAP